MPTKVQPLWPAELYAQARPDYPKAIIDAIFAACDASNPLNVVDLGAGTGICSKILIESCQKSAHGKHSLASITSLDAASNMLTELARSLYDAGGLVPTLKESGELDESVKTATGVSKFEDFDAAKYGLQGEVDLVTIAQVRGDHVAVAFTAHTLLHAPGVALVQRLGKVLEQLGRLSS